MKKSKFKLEFTLKQHTPMIHFQYNQEGATLRATELKPKLDKMIIKKMGGWSKIPIDWKVGGSKSEHRALDYKVHIVPQNRVNEVKTIEYSYERRGREQTKKFPNFFGLMGDDNEGTKEFSLFDKVDVSFSCFVPELLTTIEKVIPSFFMHNNFGTRQSKGFGSFFPENMDRIPLTYWFDVNTNNYRIRDVDNVASEKYVEYYRLFEVIQLFYSTLRSGLNQYDKGNQSIYFKSLLFLFAKEELRAEWDKRAVKKNLFNRNLSDQIRNHASPDILTYSPGKTYLMRDLMGLASVSNWWAEYKDTISTDSVDGSIERFKSPIHFKPISLGDGKYRVYFSGNQEAINGMLDAEFKVSNKAKRSFKIKTPPQFDINEYLKFALATDVKKHAVVKNGNYSQDLDLLDRIYQGIRLNSNILKR